MDLKIYTIFLTLGLRHSWHSTSSLLPPESKLTDSQIGNIEKKKAGQVQCIPNSTILWNLPAKITSSVSQGCGVMETGFHMRAFDSQFLPETGWMSSILGSSITKNTSSFMLLKAIKLASDLLLSHPLLLSLLFSLLGRKKRKFIYGPLQSPRN